MFKSFIETVSGTYPLEGADPTVGWAVLNDSTEDPLTFTLDGYESDPFVVGPGEMLKIAAPIQNASVVCTDVFRAVSFKSLSVFRTFTRDLVVLTTSGGTPADDSVATSTIQDGAVTVAKLSDEIVTYISTDLQFEAAGNVGEGELVVLNGVDVASGQITKRYGAKAQASHQSMARAPLHFVREATLDEADGTGVLSAVALKTLTGGAVGDAVFLADSGATDVKPGTYIRRVGTIVEDLTGDLYAVLVDGSAGCAEPLAASIPVLPASVELVDGEVLHDTFTGPSNGAAPTSFPPLQFFERAGFVRNVRFVGQPSFLTSYAGSDTIDFELVARPATDVTDDSTDVVVATKSFTTTPPTTSFLLDAANNGAVPAGSVLSVRITMNGAYTFAGGMMLFKYVEK